MSNRRQPPVFAGDPFATVRLGPEPVGYTNFVRPPIGQGGQGWSVDATSGIAVPANASEWSAFIAANGLTVAVPDALWLLQEASGNFADSIGGFTLTADAGNAYQQTVAGWARKGAQSPSDGTTHIGISLSASLPACNAAGAGMAIFAFVNLPSTPAANRDVYEGAGATLRTRLTATPRLAALDQANVATGTNNPTGTRPVGHQYYTPDGTTGTCVGYSDQEKLTPTFAIAAATKSLRLGGSSSGNLAPIATWLYAWGWLFGNANITSAQVKACLQAMGWTIPWS